MARHRKIPLAVEGKVDHRRRPGWGSWGGGRDAQKSEKMDTGRERKEGRRHPGRGPWIWPEDEGTVGVPGTLEKEGHRAPGLKAAGEQVGELGFILRVWGSRKELGRPLRLPDWGRI